MFCVSSLYMLLLLSHSLLFAFPFHQSNPSAIHVPEGLGGS